MDELRKGTWLVNSGKHLTRLRTSTPELDFFGATELSGKAGALLARLSADAQEVIPSAKVRIFARESGITRGELPTCLGQLRQAGKVDFTLDSNGEPNDVEVYSFSAEDALRTTASVYERLGPTDYERASLLSLDATFELPRFRTDLLETLTKSGFTESVAASTIDFQEAFSLIQGHGDPKERVLYNEYAFASDPSKIARAVRSLPEDARQVVQDVHHIVDASPGYELSFLLQKFPEHIIQLMEGVGLIDVVAVHSPHGGASFVTNPQARGISLNMPILSVDVFHRSKVLLSCLRYGEIKSSYGRGHIDSSEMLMNIVNKLNRGEWVGPCTAIGQDYQLLERDGVIVTRPADRRMYYMQLRQKEVGLVVKQMLMLGRAAPELSSELQSLLAKQPTRYDIPEEHRQSVIAQSGGGVSVLRERLLLSLRTGVR